MKKQKIYLAIKPFERQSTGTYVFEVYRTSDKKEAEKEVVRHNFRPKTQVINSESFYVKKAIMIDNETNPEFFAIGTTAHQIQAIYMGTQVN